MNCAPAPRPVRSGRYAVTPWSEERLYRPFIRAAIVIGVGAGTSTGAAMLVARALDRPLENWALLAQAHGLAQVFGWAGLFVMGVASRVVPRFRHDAPIAFPWPQRIALGGIVAGLVLRWPGQLWSDTHPGAATLVLAGLLLLLGMAVYAATIGAVLLRGSPAPVPVERWLWAGLGWSLAATGLHAWLTVRMAAAGLAAAPPELNEAMLAAGLLGFICNVLFGVSLRAVAGFLGLRPYRRRLEPPAFAAWNLGVGWLVLAALLESGPRVVAAASLLLALGGFAFTAALRVFESRTRPLGPSTRSYQRFHWFLVTAYVWLAAGLVMLALEAAGPAGGPNPLPLQARAGLHVITLGSITMTIFGFASRVLPLFEGQALRRTRWLDVSFVLLNTSVLSRLFFSLADAPRATAGLALSGLAGLLAFCCFALAMWPYVGWHRRAAARSNHRGPRFPRWRNSTRCT